ncbi:MAG: DUF2680 domain-containing protein [Bacillota bacterium]
MSKKLIVVLVTLLLLAIAVPSAYAAINDQQKSDLQSLYKKMTDIRKQMIDTYVAGGQITPDQGKNMKDNLDNAQKNIDENGISPGSGMMGSDNGSGMMSSDSGSGMMSSDSGSGMMSSDSGSGMMSSDSSSGMMSSDSGSGMMGSGIQKDLY